MSKEVTLTPVYIDIANSFASMMGEEKVMSFTSEGSSIKGFGGSMSVEYRTPEGDKENIKEPIAVYNAPEFLKIVDFVDSKTMSMEYTDPVVTIQDDSKKFKYITCPLNLVPETNPDLASTFNAQEQSYARIIIDESNLDDIVSSIGVIDIDKAYLVVKEDLSIAIELFSTKTENSIEIALNGKGSKPDKMEVPSPEVFKSLYSGLYQCDIKELEINGMEFVIMQLINKSIDAETEGTLTYSVILENDV